MDEESKLSVLANLYGQLGPLITRVNSINHELQQLKRSLSGTLPSGHVPQNKRPRTLYDIETSSKRRRLSGNNDFLELPDDIMWRILRRLDHVSLIQFSMTCKLARFFSNETLLWFPFQQNYFKPLQCNPISISSEVIRHIGNRVQIQKNWEKGEWKTENFSALQPQIVIHIDPTQSDVMITSGKNEITEWDMCKSEEITKFGAISSCSDFLVDSTSIYVAGIDFISSYSKYNKSKQYEIGGLLSNVHRIAVYRQYLVAALWDGNIKVHNAENGDLLLSIPGHRSPIHALDMKRQIIVSGSSDRSIKLWNLRGEIITTLVGHSKTVSSLQASTDARKLFSGSRDNLVKIWDTEQGTCISNFSYHTEPVNTVRWRGESIFVSAGDDKNVFIWDARQPRPVHTLSEHKSKVTSLDLDERRIVSCGANKSLIIRDFAML